MSTSVLKFKEDARAKQGRTTGKSEVEKKTGERRGTGSEEKVS